MTGRFAPYAPVCAAVAFLVTFGAQARPTRALPPVRSPFYHAEQLRSTLETQPDAARTRREYERVLNAYRVIYHRDPASPKADASIRAVGDLLAEEGRLFKLQKPLRDAIGQYEFLCQEYPSSRYRFAALLNEAQIYQRDFSDRAQAESKFEEFLSKYPNHPLAVDARAGLRELHAEEAAGKMTAHRAAASGQVLAPAFPAVSRAQREASLTGHTGIASSSPVPAVSSLRRDKQPSNQEPAAHAEELPEPEVLSTAEANSPTVSHHDRPARVTAIRYWSNSSYTRIAIDLEDQVGFQAAHVPNPDRIFFDLRETHLISRLNGMSLDVTDAGFLKRIRSAQYSGDVTRIVLDISSRADYNAFFLPNPWRLIIDIHEHKHGPALQQTVAAPRPERPAPQAGARSDAAAVLQHAQNSHRQNELESLLTVPVVPAPVATVAPTQNPTQNLPTRSYRSKPSPFIEAAPGQNSTSPSTSATWPATAATQPAAGELDRQKTTPPGANAQPSTLQSTDQSLNSTGRHHAASSATVPFGSPASGSFGTDAQDDTGRADDGGAYEQRAPDRSNADPERSLVRTLGLKIGRIVIDAGHGGHDCGTLGPGGIQEKDVTLDVALRLGKMLKKRLGADVIYTRADDTFIPLQVRTAMANKANADLFISIHANSSSDPSARGVESYYLNFTTSPDALEVAARENAVSDNSIHELSDLVKQITLKDKIEESREFAADVQRSLYSGLEQGNPGLKDRGVKKAPFVVLIGANMPSILAEISFLTNPDDARQLRQPAYRERIADSLYQGVAKYVTGLSGVRLAENRGHAGTE
ncbi:MAG TPA: N-acetylmuramoyl-L-alanine amidase [Acidobacteriaceae bacterium]